MKTKRQIASEPAAAINTARYPSRWETQPKSVEPKAIPKSKAVKNEALATPIRSRETMRKIAACSAGWAEPKPMP